MAMRLTWTARYNKSLENIFSCAVDFYTEKTLRELNTSIKGYEGLLIDNPTIGAREPLLFNRDFEYRHIVINPFFKIIYTIQDDCIYMIDIWDTRRDPRYLAKGFA